MAGGRLAAGRRGQVHVVAAAAAAAAARIRSAVTAGELLLVVSVRVGLCTDPGIPRLVGVERPKAARAGASAAGVRGLVCAGRGAVVAVLKLANLRVDEADDAAGRRPWRAVGVVACVPGKI